MSTPMTRPIGREPALAALAEAWERARAGEGQTVLVAGEAGLGKTLVVRAFTAGLDAAVLTGQCVSLGADVVPYAAVSQVLRGLAHEVGLDQVRRWAGPGCAALSALLPALAVPDAGPSAAWAPDRTGGVRVGDPTAAVDVERVQLFSTVVDVLEQAARARPLVVVLEDLHWADQGTGHLARLLAPALSQAPVLLLLTYRSEELTGRHPLRPVVGELARRGTALHLGALAPEHTAEIVRGLLPGGTPAAVNRIVERSEGVPYFAEELAVTTAGLGALPGTLRDALLTRVHWLTPAAQQVLRLAAVAGPTFTHRLLAAAVEGPPAELDAALREIVDAGLLVVEGDGYAFRHALLRDAVHDDLLPGEHDRLHGRLADLIQQRGDLVDPRSNELAHHLLAARRLEEAFVECLTRAADGEAVRADSLTLFESALELWDRVPEPERVLGPRHAVLALAAEAALFLGERGRAARYIDASLAELPDDADPLVLSARLRQQARSRYWGPEALPLAQRALDVCPRERPTLELARAHDMLANLSAVTGHRERAAELATAGLAVARAVGDRGTEANLLITLGGARCSTGRTAEGLALFDQALRAVPEAALVGGTWGLMRYHTNLSHYRNLAGDFERAAEVAGRGEANATAAGLRLFKGTMLAGNLAEPLIALGRWGDAESVLRNALAVFPPTTQLNALLAELAIGRGELDRGRGLLDELAAELPQVESQPQYREQYAWVEALWRLAGGDDAGALALARAALARAESEHPTLRWRIACLGARAARRTGADPAARAELTDAVAALAATPGEAAWRAWFDAERLDTADAWRAALAADEGRPVVAELWLHLGLVERLVADGDLAGARAAHAAGRDLADRVGADGWRRALDATLGDAAGPAPRPAAASGGPGLTPRELEVLRLVAEGRTNGEIGAALFVSTKTASVHVSNILAKLGVASRGEAAAWAHRSGVLE